MKAAVYDVAGTAQNFRYVDVPDPEVGPNEVLLRVEAISIEGGDLVNRRSIQPPHPGFIVGFAASGTVIAVGQNVRDRAVGDRVTSFDLQGSHAELRAVPASRTWLLPLGIDMQSAAALPIAFGTADHCLFERARLKQGETLLIQAAAGGVGLAAIELAAQAGAKIIAVASGEQRIKALTALGAHLVVDRTSSDVIEEVRRFTGGAGVDVVLDPVGTTLQSSLSALRPEGRLVFVGNAGGGDLSADLWPAMQSNQTLFGVFMGPLLERPVVHQRIDTLIGDVSTGKLQVVIDRVFALADVTHAHEYAETAKPLGRVILHP
jgi:NADPH2:quinone reductase